MPLTLADLTARDRTWTLDAFVDEVNRLLPMVLPDAAPGRAKAEVNARLVRHYTTEGVLPKPLKEAGEARYAADHLVRALALRRLLADGFPSGVAGTVLERHDTEALARLLVGELRVGVDLEPDVVATPAVDPVAHLPEPVRARLADLRRRAGLPPLGVAPAAAQRTMAAPMRAAPMRSESDADELASAPAPLLHRRSLEGEAWSRRAPVRAPAPRGSTEGGVAWTRYPLLDGLELHVRADFADPPTPTARERLRDVLLARLEAIALEREARRR
ncbi:MAG: MerR family transcriptional regulator [Trueperaceae bacterium]